MKDFVIDVDPANVDPDGLCDGNSSAITQLLIDGALSAGEDLDGLADGNSSAGASVTLDGALTTTEVYTDRTGILRHIYILDAGGDDQSGATYTIVGTDVRGDFLTEALTGPASGLFVVSVNRYKTVSSITIASPAAGSTVDIGVLGHFTSADGLAHRLNFISSAHDQSGNTLTITGTDADGRVQTESSLTAPGSGATVESTKYFLTVSNIVLSAGTAASTLDIGTVDEATSKTIPMDWYAPEAAVIQLDVTGTISVDVQITLKNPFKIEEAAPYAVTDQEAYNWLNDGNFTTETADIALPLSMKGIKAIRVVTNSYTNTAEVQAFVSQPRNTY